VEDEQPSCHPEVEDLFIMIGLKSYVDICAYKVRVGVACHACLCV
jgi:hypothetical protein